MSQQTSRLPVRRILKRLFLGHDTQPPLAHELTGDRGLLREVCVIIIALRRVQVRRIGPKGHLKSRKPTILQHSAKTNLLRRSAIRA